MNFIAYLLSVLSFATAVASVMIKGEEIKQLGFMLILAFFSNLFASLGYIFNPEGINGLLSCGLGCVIAIVNFYFRIKNIPIPKAILALYYIVFFVINVMGDNSFILTLLAILATFSFVLALSQKNGISFRFWQIVNCFLWIIYDIISKTYNQCALHGAIMIFTIICSLYFDRKKEC